MNRWKSRLAALIDRTDQLSDTVRLRLRKITGFNNPLMIIPYLGYGTADKLLLAGRVLEDEGFTPSSSADSTLRNLINMYKRFETDEVPGARIRARFQEIESEAIADNEGYFSFEIQTVQALGRSVATDPTAALGSSAAQRTSGTRHCSGAGPFRNRQIRYH